MIVYIILLIGLVGLNLFFGMFDTLFSADELKDMGIKLERQHS